jgi:nuclear pore complex protein Nup107
MIALQAAIISKNVDSYFFEQGVVFAQQASANGPSSLIPGDDLVDDEVDHDKYLSLGDHDGLRIFAHVLILLTAFDSLESTNSGDDRAKIDPRARTVQEHIITAYASFLRLAGVEELVPLYCSLLTNPRRYHVLSRNLIHVTNADSRLLHLSLIRKAGLNQVTFVKCQPELFFQDVGDEHKTSSAVGLFRIMDSGPQTLKYGRSIRTDFFGDDPDSIEQGDELLIRSIEWLVLVDEAWPDVFMVGVRVYKYFLRKSHPSPVRGQIANK